MHETFPYGKLPYYPHMKPRDIAIWERFMLQFPDMYDKVAYDVPCGSLPPFPTLVDGELETSMEKLYRKKIDVVGFKAEQIDIIELKPDAGTSSLGQVKGYVRDYIVDYGPSVTPKPIVVTDRLLPGMDTHAAAEGVLMVVV